MTEKSLLTKQAEAQEIQTWKTAVEETCNRSDP